MAKPTTKGLLKQISSDDIEWVYVHITEKAVEWAIAGFIDEANRLLEQLWKFNIPHSGNLWLTDQGLEILWKVSNKRPSNVPFQTIEVSDIPKIEEDNWSSSFFPVWHQSYTDSFIKKPLGELEGHELFVKAIIALHERSEDVNQVLNALRRYIDNDKPVGHAWFHAATCGALLAARLDYQDAADYFITLWGKGYLKYSVNYTLGYLMRDTKAAAYLLKGTLAPVFKLSQELIQKETTEIIGALSNRIRSGRALAYKKLSWKQLLDRISEIAIKQKTTDFSKRILETKTLSGAPATKKEITATEKRLNIVLPDDYKKFLLVSNGFECFSITGVTVAPVDKIDFLFNVDKELIDIWTEDSDAFDPTFSIKLKSSIMIGGFQEEQQLLLVPLQNNNWECWHFSSWRPGESVFQSFRFYMEDELQKLEDDFYVH